MPGAAVTHGADARAAVAVFARAPSAPGKTRLLPHLTETRLNALRLALLEDALDAVAAVAHVERYLFFTPSDAHDEVAALAADRFTTIAQQGSDLGERMRAAFEHLLVRRGHRAAVLVGSDIPRLTRSPIEHALSALDSDADVALGPALDGGYYLIAMRALHAPLLRDIPWGSDSVFDRTIAAAHRLRLSCAVVDRLYDVDVVDDLETIRRDCEHASTTVGSRVRKWIEDGH